MGKYKKITLPNLDWTVEDQLHLELIRLIVAAVENFEKIIRNTSSMWLSLFQKHRDLQIRRNIISENTVENIFPAAINSHVHLTLSLESTKKILLLEKLTENYSKSLNDVSCASQHINVCKTPTKNITTILSKILDTSLGIIALGTNIDIMLNRSIEVLRCGKVNLQSTASEVDHMNEFSKLLRFINEFLIYCRTEKLLNG